MSDDTGPRPLPFDPSKDDVAIMLRLTDDRWWLTADGAFQTAAVEAMRTDGSHYQRVIALTWPARRNHSAEETQLNLLIHPDDAEELAYKLLYTAHWLRTATQMGN